MEEVLRPASGARPVLERDEAASIRRASWRSFAVLRLKDPNQLLERITADTRELLEASIVRLLQLEGQDASELPCKLPEEALPPLAEEMEQALLVRAIAESKSLVSAHPQLDPSLAELATPPAAAGQASQLTSSLPVPTRRRMPSLPPIGSAASGRRMNGASASTTTGTTSALPWR
jgi:hypothetical protein